MRNRDATAEILVAFVGFLTSEADRDRYGGFSQAANLFQDRMLDAISRPGIRIDRVYSSPPERPFPRGKLFLRGRISRTAAGFDATQLPFLNLGIIKVASLSAVAGLRLTWWAMRSRRKPRVILLYNTFPIPPLVSLFVRALTGARVVAIVADFHVPGSAGWSDNVLRRLQFALDSRALAIVDGVIALTEPIARDFAPGRPHIVVEAAVAADAIPVARAEPPTEPFVLMYSGHFSLMKGIPLLIDAFAHLAEERFRLWLTGSGDLEPLVREAAARDSRIRYWGFLPYREVLSLYESASLLVNPFSTRFPSSKYMFPSKLVEYLASGRPVITTCSPGVREMYGPYVYMLTEESPRALAERIREIASLPATERAEQAAAARAFVLREKTWDRQGERISRFLTEVVPR